MTNIHILPCLQELKQARLFEPEQQEGIFDANTNKMKYKYGRFNDTSDQYDKIWSGKTIDLLETIYLIPSFRKYGFSGQCKKYGMIQKWKMYFDYFYDTLPDTKQEEISVIMVTHHNRLRSNNSYQGLFPMNSGGDTCNAYANTFCLKIYTDEKDINNLNCKIVYQGVPDKGTFQDNCISDNLANTSSISNLTTMSKRSISTRSIKSKRRFTPKLSKISEGVEQEGGGGKTYNYCCSTKFGNDNNIFSNSLDIVRTAFKQSKFFINGKLESKFNIYIIRHGNAIHNKAIKKDVRREAKGYERIDSSLSDEGRVQAENLGRILKETENINTRSLLVCTSFLTRTKHTALLLMEQLYGSTLDIKLKEKKEELNDISTIREEPLLKKVDEAIKKVDRSLLITSKSIRPSSRSLISSYTMSGSGLKKHNRTKRRKRIRKKKSGGYKSRKI